MTDLFFSFSEEQDRRAVQRCHEECPVRLECLDFALETRQEQGVWGGLTARELARVAEKKRRMGRQCAECGASFEPYRNISRFCSARCSMVWNSRVQTRKKVRRRQAS